MLLLVLMFEDFFMQYRKKHYTYYRASLNINDLKRRILLVWRFNLFISVHIIYTNKVTSCAGEEFMFNHLNANRSKQFLSRNALFNNVIFQLYKPRTNDNNKGSLFCKSAFDAFFRTCKQVFAKRWLRHGSSH